MLVRCPKCHFEQPKERFCANCGVDMFQYKPPNQGFIAALLKNATLLFFIAIIGIFSGTYFYIQSQRKVLSLDQNTHKNFQTQRNWDNSNEAITVSGHEVNDPKQATPNTPSNDGAKQANLNTTGTSSIHPESPQTKNIKDQSPQEIEQSLNKQLFKEASDSVDLSNQIKITVKFAEVSLKGIDLLQQEARLNGQLMNLDYMAGVGSSSISKLASLKDEFIFYNELAQKGPTNRWIEWFQGLKSSSQKADVGLHHYVQVKKIENGLLRVEVRIVKGFEEPSSDDSQKNFQKKEYVMTAEVAKGQPIFITEVLTPISMSSNQEYLTSISPFEIYKSQNFQEQKTISAFLYSIDE